MSVRIENQNRTWNVARTAQIAHVARSAYIGTPFLATCAKRVPVASAER
jgi:hypothetical protein